MKMMAAILAISMWSLPCVGPHAQLTNTHLPSRGLIPDAGTAAKVAEAILSPIYGDDIISREKPFCVTLHGDVWTVTGTIKGKGLVGGVATIKMRKSSGQILYVFHSV